MQVPDFVLKFCLPGRSIPVGADVTRGKLAGVALHVGMNAVGRSDDFDNRLATGAGSPR